MSDPVRAAPPAEGPFCRETSSRLRRRCSETCSPGPLDSRRFAAPDMSFSDIAAGYPAVRTAASCQGSRWKTRGPCCARSVRPGANLARLLTRSLQPVEQGGHPEARPEYVLLVP